MSKTKKIFLFFLALGFLAGCHPKRAPKRGCDCPGGLLFEKKETQHVSVPFKRHENIYS